MPLRLILLNYFRPVLFTLFTLLCRLNSRILAGYKQFNTIIMGTIQVKLFWGSRLSDMQTEINNWLSNELSKCKFELISLTQSECENNLSITLLYRLLA